MGLRLRAGIVSRQPGSRSVSCKDLGHWTVLEILTCVVGILTSQHSRSSYVRCGVRVQENIALVLLQQETPEAEAFAAIPFHRPGSRSALSLRKVENK